MTLTVVVMDIEERIIKFLDTDLLDIEETIEKNGLRTLKIEYTFQDLQDDKTRNLFRIGNKIWVQGDKHLTDCLYVINTEVTENIYDENKFTLEVEEVLVELNYAPLFSQTELDVKDSNNRYLFSRGTSNGQQYVNVNWNALNYWFGDYFNIGVVQDCSTPYARRVTLSGTVNLMTLLRQIEEETGNIFVTRYEKDLLDNTIHRYLDFLNPNNINKNWTVQYEYDFVDDNIQHTDYDANDNPIPTPDPSTVTPMNNQGQDIPYDYNTDSGDDEEWYEYNTDYTPLKNINPEDVVFQITNKNSELLNTDGTKFHDDGDYPLEWSSEEIGFNTDTENVVFSLCRQNKNIGLDVNGKSFAVADPNYTSYKKSSVPEINDETLTPVYISDDSETILEVSIPDDSYFTIYDTSNDQRVFHSQLNTQIGHTHYEVLDFTHNMEAVEYTTDETDTYNSIAPILNPNGDANNKITNTDIKNIIQDWKNLSVTKGETIPMKIQKETIPATIITTPCDTANPGILIDKVKCSLGNFNKNTSPNRSTSKSDNYWSRPVKPSDKIDTQDTRKSSFEFWRGTAYWRAPFTKHSGDLHVETDVIMDTQYRNVRKRGDRRRTRGNSILPKQGTVETSEEDPYAIYNKVALKLKDKQYPKFKISVDVGSYKNGEFNNYQLHDKVYVKLPGNNELVYARIVKTVKNAHDFSENTVELDNYSLNTVKTVQYNTYIQCSNYSFHYPNSATLTARLVNEDYNPDDAESVQYPVNRLIKLLLYKLENGSRSRILKMYTKFTNVYGQVKLPLHLKPGNYEVLLTYGGDEEYFESTARVRVNVSGQVETAALKEAAKVKFKTVAKNNTTTTTKTRYWTKCGKSPISKKGQTPREVCAIARPSAGDGSYSYRWWKTVFKNRCPECGKTGTLVYDSGTSKTKCIYCGPYNGSKRTWGNIAAECEISCSSCCSDFDGVTGLEKNEGHSTRLTTVKKPVPASYSDVAKLANGKLVYDTKKITVKKKVVNNKNNRRRIANNIPKSVVNKTLSVIGDKTGIKAAKAICGFMGGSISYSCYSGFHRSSASVLSRGSGNCCDQTRLMLQMFDVAGLSEFYVMKYVHVVGGKGGHVFGKLIVRKTGNWTYVDPCKADPWGHYVTGYGVPPGTQTTVSANNLINGLGF